MPESRQLPADFQGSLEMVRPVLYIGSVTSIAAAQLNDTAAAWPNDLWGGAILEIITGADRGRRVFIRGNDNDSLFLGSGLGTVVAGDAYAIIPAPSGMLFDREVVIRSASGNLTAGETTTGIEGFGWAKEIVVRLDVTTITTQDADDTVTFFLQTSFNSGTDWVDLENIHFTNADNGNTAVKLLVVSRVLTNAVARDETDGTLANNTKLDLPCGDRLRFRTAVAGATAPTYAYAAQALVRG